LQWLVDGDVHKSVTELFVQQEIRGAEDKRYREYVKDLFEAKHSCRNAIANDKMIPLVVSGVTGSDWRALSSIDTV
jgi:hypothetical protein